MEEDYIEVVWTTDKGKKIEYINRNKLENPIKKEIMKNEIKLIHDNTLGTISGISLRIIPFPA